MRHWPYRVPVYSLPFLNTNAYTPQKGWARRWIPRIEGKHKSCRLVRGPACNDMLPLSQKPKLTVRTQGDSCDWRRRPARHAQWADLQQKPRTDSTSSCRYHTHRSPCPARVEDLGEWRCGRHMVRARTPCHGCQALPHAIIAHLHQVLISF